MHLLVLPLSSFMVMGRSSRMRSIAAGQSSWKMVGVNVTNMMTQEELSKLKMIGEMYECIFFVNILHTLWTNLTLYFLTKASTVGYSSHCTNLKAALYCTRSLLHQAVYSFGATTSCKYNKLISDSTRQDDKRVQYVIPKKWDNIFESKVQKKNVMIQHFVNCERQS